MVSKITDRVLPEIKEWQSRPLNPIYPFVFMDCIHYKVREDGRILSRAAYIVLGVTLDGYKDILSITVGANETSKFWLGMLNDLKNRGVAVAGIRDNDIRKNGVGMLTAVTENPHHTKVGLFTFTGLEVNDGATIVVMDVTVTGASTYGTGFKFGLKFSHVGIKKRF